MTTLTDSAIARMTVAIELGDFSILPEDEQPWPQFQTLTTALLLAISQGKIDARIIAAQELRNRYRDPKTGEYVPCPRCG